MEYFTATATNTNQVLIIDNFVLTLGNNTVLTIGEGGGAFNQILNVIPRESLTTGTLVITDEFTQVETTIELTGTYANGFYTASFVFEPTLGSDYKLFLYKDNQIVWKGKARAVA